MMSGVGDNYLAAFAIFLKATVQQVGRVTASARQFGVRAQLQSVRMVRAAFAGDCS